MLMYSLVVLFGFAAPSTSNKQPNDVALRTTEATLLFATAFTKTLERVEKPVVFAVPLKKIDADSAAQRLKVEMAKEAGYRVVAESNTNRVVVQAETEKQARLLEKILYRLDGRK